METLEELQMHRQASLIVVYTLGLAAVPIALNWKSNLFPDFVNAYPKIDHQTILQ